jgi:Protein of unknown function (DUF3240)
MTTTYDCMLTLAVPDHLEEEMLDLLLAHEDIVSGFSVYAAEGLGSGAHLHTMLEQVRGRSRRRMITLLMQGTDASTLIDRIKVQVPSPEIVWWTTALTGFGRLA